MALPVGSRRSALPSGRELWKEMRGSPVPSPAGSQKKKSSDKVGRHPMETRLGSPAASLKWNWACETFQHQHKEGVRGGGWPHQNYHLPGEFLMVVTSCEEQVTQQRLSWQVPGGSPVTYWSSGCSSLQEHASSSPCENTQGRVG